MEECVFCKIIKGELPSTKEFENERILAFRDINPVAPTHILIVPKKHLVSLAHVSDEDGGLLGEIQLATRQIAEKLNINEAFRVVSLNGQNAGQRVFHLHYHLLGGWEGKAPRVKKW